MIFLKTKDEIRRIKDSNQIIAEVLLHIKDFIKPGITTGELDKEIETFILKKNAKPSFKGFHGYPASSCISINDEVVHGIPSKKRVIKNGDIVGVDVGVELNNYFGDSAYTFVVDKVSEDVKRLLKVTEESLYYGIEQCRAGKKIGDIGNAIQTHVESNNFNVVREMVGHGVGRAVHEDPQIPNYGKPNRGTAIKEGMVLAIEPMVNMGTHEIYIADDKWTVKSKDGSLSAHYEHSVAITSNGPEILSQLDGV